MSLEALKEPFDNVKWRIQSGNKTSGKGVCVAYIDSRQVMDRLDHVVGSMNWKDEYFSIGNKWICGLSIWDDEKTQWVTKYDTGDESKTEGNKGQVSDAFKRAAVKWGIGRFLYEYLTFVDVKFRDNDQKKPYPVDKNGYTIWDLTKFINNKGKNNEKTAPDPKTQIKLNKIQDKIQQRVNDVGVEQTLKEAKSKYQVSEADEQAIKAMAKPAPEPQEEEINTDEIEF